MRLPQSWTEEKKQTPVLLQAKHKIESRVNMSDEVAGQELCPVCGQKMERVIVNDQPALCCFDDRVVIPIKNEKLEAEQ